MLATRVGLAKLVLGPDVAVHVLIAHIFRFTAPIGVLLNGLDRRVR